MSKSSWLLGKEEEEEELTFLPLSLQLPGARMEGAQRRVRAEGEGALKRPIPSSLCHLWTGVNRRRIDSFYTDGRSRFGAESGVPITIRLCHYHPPITQCSS